MKIAAHLEFDTFAEAERVFRHLGMLTLNATGMVVDERLEATGLKPGSTTHGDAKTASGGEGGKPAHPTPASGVDATTTVAPSTASTETTLDELKDAFRVYLGRAGGRTAMTGRQILLHHGVASGKIGDVPDAQRGVLRRAFDTAGPEMPLGEGA